ncbi:hypothetical protein MF672_003300 [Actinomadura sp. ATCC 31491]|uniref:Uncharacterized protein n=1 Tax=Actinomadura luzonensis TaxID=2805427 RepID=A0ABT0FKJ7_9ACTN|nr:hypothetical protein [Actinomadura luzonensis]MCK2212828.1 hypothetical protein [Actinomadura luzonensis]
MPSPAHATLAALFDDRPTLAVELLCEAFDIDLPPDTLVAVSPDDVPEPPGLGGEPETVFAPGPAHGVLVELLRTPCEDDRQAWARRGAALWLRLNRPVVVLVLAPDGEVAAWASQPVVTSMPGYVVHPLVVGPEQLSPLADPAEAAGRLELSVLSVMAHGAETPVAEAFLGALSKVEEERGARYLEYAYHLSPGQVRRVLEESMSSAAWPVHSPFAREHYTKGRAAGLAEGKARAVLTVLRARGVALTDDARSAITSCADQQQLDEWARRAAVAQRVEDLFA